MFFLLLNDLNRKNVSNSRRLSLVGKLLHKYYFVTSFANDEILKLGKDYID